VVVGRPDVQPFGLVELVDNNPLVCSEACSVPSPEGTFALIALGPLIRAGLLMEAPVALYSFQPSESLIATELSAEGWTGGLTIETTLGNARDVDAPRSAIFTCIISGPEDSRLLDSLYDGIYGGSFFVRRVEDGPWITDIVEDHPFAAYRLSIAPDFPQSLLTIKVMSDVNGKIGAAQTVHCLNVMCGFEESLGLEL
jgi:N-acetyl-gamma-glutamylphosphate reductase